MIAAHGTDPAPTRLKAVRFERGWKKSQLMHALRHEAAKRGIRLGGDASLKREIAYWENENRRLTDTVKELLCAAYQVTPEALGFLPDDQPEADPVGQQLAARLATARSVDRELVSLLEMQIHAIRLKDRRIGAAAIAQEMAAFRAQVADLLSHCLNPAIRALLADVLADADSLSGWQSVDVGDLDSAWRHFEEAKAAAREAEDPQLLAFSTAEQAYVLLDIDQPADALTLIQHAHNPDRRKLPPLLRSWLYAAESEAYAALGDEPTALRTMDAAASMLPSDAADPAMPYLALNLTHLARWRGNCLARLGDHQAIEDLTTALTGMDGTFTRAEAGLRCDLASALVAAGDFTAARAELEHARRLVTIAGSVRQRRRLDRLAARLTSAGG